MCKINLLVVAGALYCAALFTPLFAQTASLDRVEQLDLNQSKLKVTLTLDRPEYFPGEIAELIIQIDNPTEVALEVPAPFTSSTGLISFFEKGNRMARTFGQTYGPLSAGPYTIELGDSQPLPTVVLKPHESQVKRLRSYESNFGDSQKVMLGGAAPNWTGEFRLSYWGGTADFRVVMPTYEGMLRIDWPESEERPVGYPAQGTVRTPKRVHAFVLSAGGTHFLCVDKVPYAGSIDPPPTDSAGRLVDNEFHFNRYSRVAESGSPIDSLTGTADAAGNIALAWGVGGGRRLFIDRRDLLLNSPKNGQ